MAGTMETAKPSTVESVKRWPEITKNYIDELRQEMKRVTWPTRNQVQATTAVVILTVFAFALYFKIVDEIITHTVTRLYTDLAK
jgi:preprotein translocase subunit SecE